MIDERVPTHLGWHKAPSGEKVTLTLSGGAPKALLEFYQTTLPADSTRTPICITIKALNVQASKRRMKNAIAEIGRAHVDLVFSEWQGDSLVERYRIQHNEDQLFDLGDRATLFATHERRIRAALEYGLKAFDAHYTMPTLPLVPGPTEPVHFDAGFPNPKFERQLGNWINLVAFKVLSSTYHQGWALSYTGFVDSDRKFIAPYEISVEAYTVRPNIALSRGYYGVSSFVSRPELYFLYKKIFPGLYVSMSLNVPVGVEFLEDLDRRNSANFVIGVGASQGIRIVPWQKYGVVLGVDFFQEFQTSKVYRADIGVEFVIGVNF